MMGPIFETRKVRPRDLQFKITQLVNGCAKTSIHTSPTIKYSCFIVFLFY